MHQICFPRKIPTLVNNCPRVSIFNLANKAVDRWDLSDLEILILLCIKVDVEVIQLWILFCEYALVKQSKCNSCSSWQSKGLIPFREFNQDDMLKVPITCLGWAVFAIQFEHWCVKSLILDCISNVSASGQGNRAYLCIPGVMTTCSLRVLGSWTECLLWVVLLKLWPLAECCSIQSILQPPDYRRIRLGLGKVLHDVPQYG